MRTGSSGAKLRRGQRPEHRLDVRRFAGQPHGGKACERFFYRERRASMDESEQRFWRYAAAYFVWFVECFAFPVLALDQPSYAKHMSESLRAAESTDTVRLTSS